MTTKTKAAAHPFRIILRGHDSKGKYHRAVRTVHAPNADAAYGYLAENGDKLAKSAGFKVEFTNVLEPVPSYVRKFMASK
jgi:hypothetical protein